MPSTPPEGDPAPLDGALPESALAGLADRRLSFYVHVPYCATRCGYCDFNTYTAAELGGGASQAGWAVTAGAEIALSGSVLGDTAPAVSTVFFGGGTPTLLPSADLVRVLDAIGTTYGLAADAEVTTEANPDSVTPESLAALRDGGFTRVSFGMQSAVPHVLAGLERTHDPARVPLAVAWARAAGFEQVSLDLIYGGPGETDADWRASLAAALACEPDHVSAYSLIVEPGTRLAAQVVRGERTVADDDALADRYVAADETLSRAGYAWYEVSNWARPDAECRHNLSYWRGDDWWGVGPGAHSHVGGVRWWNVRHPSAWTTRLAAGESPAQARELLTPDERVEEQVLLEVRLRDGIAVADVPPAGRPAIPGLVADGLVDEDGDRLRLTLRGRLLADGVVRALLPD